MNNNNNKKKRSEKIRVIRVYQICNIYVIFVSEDNKKKMG